MVVSGRLKSGSTDAADYQIDYLPFDPVEVWISWACRLGLGMKCQTSAASLRLLGEPMKRRITRILRRSSTSW